VRRVWLRPSQQRREILLQQTVDQDVAAPHLADQDSLGGVVEEMDGIQGGAHQHARARNARRNARGRRNPRSSARPPTPRPARTAVRRAARCLARGVARRPARRAARLRSLFALIAVSLDWDLPLLPLRGRSAHQSGPTPARRAARASPIGQHQERPYKREEPSEGQRDEQPEQPTAEHPQDDPSNCRRQRS